MTRINCVPVRELTDQHLLAEYREITRVSRLARQVPPGEYTMGTGHVRFFYDKGGYLKKRTRQLYRECRRRGFRPKEKVYNPHPRGLNKDWAPSDKALSVNRQRIDERISSRPGYYRYEGLPL